MWEKINSPIIVAVVVIIALFVLKNMEKPTLATEMRGAYEEFNAILEDSSSDAEKTKAIQQFATEVGTQIREGFQAGFSNPVGEDGKPIPSKDKLFLEAKTHIVISEFKFVPAKWGGRDEFIYRVTNKSEHHISQLRLNLEYYKDGELVDVKNKWISEIKILPPGESIAMRGDHSYPNGTKPEDYDQFKVDDVKLLVTSFDIKEDL